VCTSLSRWMSISTFIGTSLPWQRIERCFRHCRTCLQFKTTQKLWTHLEVFRVTRCPDLKIHGRTVIPTGHNSGSRIFSASAVSTQSLVVTYFGLWAALTFLSLAVSFSEVGWLVAVLNDMTRWERNILYDFYYGIQLLFRW